MRLRTFVKKLKELSDMPLTSLDGFEKLSDHDRYILGLVVAGIANDINDQEFESIIEETKLGQLW